MKIWRLDSFAGGVALVQDEVPVPRPGRGELLICVYAAGVTPSELLWYPTTHTKAGEPRVDAVPGHEFSGVVAETGEGVDPAHTGVEVYGMNDWFAGGAMSEYCLTTPSAIAPKPAGLTHAQAASVPIGALTAWQGLFDRAKLRPGERVLIQGAAGAVGVYAVQLARYQGARVIATASPRNTEFVRNLGADQVIDYRSTRFEDAISDIDVVFDTVGGDTLRRSWAVLAPGGRMVAIAAGEENTTDERIKQAFFIVEPNQYQLIQVADLLRHLRIHPVVDAVVPFDRAGSAYAGDLPDRLGRGKVVVSLIAAIS